MPTYEYLCSNPDCIGEFEEFHSITTKLEECPHCKTAGRGVQVVQRLISGGSGKGIMEQSFSEMKAALPGQIAKIKQRAARDENYLANLVGETKYNRNQS
jgi:putative FmdB family regulatory protein